MDEFKARVRELADLMDEFDLAEAKLEGDGWKVAFRRSSASSVAPVSAHEGSAIAEHAPTDSAGQPSAQAAPVASEPAGTPLESPMNGIYYSSPSPNAPMFVHEGDEVEEGQVVALIEAMKVFNEIVAPADGRVTGIVAENAQLVQAGDVLMYIESGE